ncbi:DivIVA domain-containing protein [Aeromicrobium fastidiosum]|uniref:Cell wall synthesis protein Wag31 n=1 Tax=Aeromicrobium fastidiosum TaxID=52699 RepID=A0A641AN35_9ACTN|nr:DivIVA domain-containing protein [Aeromicrobium fastidiosum]KAA1378688.1 DivIVA domain-containing protein [Aeromicrobium fastidiosum]
MPLTPEDVRNKRFTPVRLREGYDMGEVDQFLDEVEAELERLTVENEELRAKVAAASTGEPTGLIPALSSPAPAAQAAPTPAVQEPVKVEPTPAPEPEPAPVPVAAAPAPVAAPRPSMGDASSAAARLLEIASTNADQLMDAAKEEADRMVGEARAKAERITNEARGKADRLETDARIRAQKLDEETNERRTAAVATIERDRYEIQREVEHLRAYEREYRARLKNYFQSQLDQLAANESTTASTPVQAPADAAPRRLRSLLGDDENL